jgi:hypothetical protein
MIGDFFGGIGACGGQPVFLGRAVFHSAATTLGDDDFHLIAPGSPTTFLSGAGGSTGVAFVGPANMLTGFGRPGQFFVAIPTAEIVDVNDPAGAPGEFDDLQVFNIFTSEVTEICLPSPGTSGVGRVKLAENTSPIPRDRVFLNYSHFNNVPLQAGGVNVNRFVPGFEKTFFNGITSFELRAPFATTLNSDLIAAQLNDDNHTEFGNLSLVSKTLLAQNNCWAYAAGIQVALPTADDVRLSTLNGVPLVHVENEAVHLMPYVGALYTPNDRFFFQLFLQVDTNVNDHSVAIRDPFTGALAPADDLDDTDFLYVDLSWGYWLYRNNCCCSPISGFAPIFEVHWNSSLENTQSVTANGFRVGTSVGDIDLVNLVFGATLECGGNTSISTAFVTPVAGGDDKDFDGEFRLILNRRFGPQNRATRAQF